MPALRYDRAALRSRRDADGFLYSDSTVARTGILQYRNADGSIRRELRLPEEAGSPATLQSMVGKPVIVLHAGGMVNKDNAKNRVVGAMLNARQDGQLTNAEIVVHDGQAIRDAEKGVYPELSLGYKLDLEKRSGYYHADRNEISDKPGEGFEPFDYIQRNISVNHVALVRQARAGSVARLNFDGDEIFENEDKNSMKIKINGVEVEVSEEVGQHVNTLQTRLDGVNAELSTTKGTLTAVQGEVTALKAEVSGFPAKLEQARTDAAEELTALDALRQSVAHKVTDTAGKSAVEIKRAFIAAVMPSVNLDGKDDLEVNGAFDYALAANPASASDKQRNDSKDRHIGGGKDKERTDHADDAANAADAGYAKMLANLGIK